MTEHERARVKMLIALILADKATATVPELHDDFDLRGAGLIDSLRFLQLISELERRLGYHVDLADLNPADLTKIGPLSQHIAWRREQS